jgi:hypothetical protein
MGDIHQAADGNLKRFFRGKAELYICSGTRPTAASIGNSLLVGLSLLVGAT